MLLLLVDHSAVSKNVSIHALHYNCARPAPSRGVNERADLRRNVLRQRMAALNAPTSGASLSPTMLPIGAGAVALELRSNNLVGDTVEHQS